MKRTVILIFRNNYPQSSFLHSFEITPLCLCEQVPIPYLGTILQGRSNYTAIKGPEVIFWCTITLKVPLTRKFLLHNEKLCTFALQRFVDEIFQFEYFVYVTPCIMKHQKVDYKVVFL